MTTPAQSGGRRVGLLALGVSLFDDRRGALLSHADTPLRASLMSGPPLDPSQLIPEDRASLTVWWWDQTNSLCGPFPAIWPAVVVLRAAPLIVAAMQRHATSPLWGRLGLLGAVLACRHRTGRGLDICRIRAISTIPAGCTLQTWAQ